MLAMITVHSGVKPMPIDSKIFRDNIVLTFGEISDGIEFYLDEKDATSLSEHLQNCLAQIKKAPEGAEKNTTTTIIQNEEEESNVA